MIEFTPLASSSAGCAYRLVSPGVAPLLLDCGIRFPLLQRALDFRVTQLAGCLVSHAHGDHCAAVKDLLKWGVKCYGSKQTWERLDLSGAGVKQIAHGEIARIGDWLVKPFEAVHDLPGTLGFVIDGGGARCLYLTDSAYSRFRFEGLTHIFIECNHSQALIREGARQGDIQTERYQRTVMSHMSLERLLELLAANDLSKVQEIHLLHLSDANSDERAFKEAVQRQTGCPVYIAAKAGAIS